MILPISQTSVTVLITSQLCHCRAWAGNRQASEGGSLRQVVSYSKHLKAQLRPENPHLSVMNPPCNHLNTQTRHACEIPEVVAN